MGVIQAVVSTNTFAYKKKLWYFAERTASHLSRISQTSICFIFCSGELFYEQHH